MTIPRSTLAPWLTIGACAVCACSGRVAAAPSASDSGPGQDAPTLGVGSIDASGLSPDLAMTCDGIAPALSLSLPCKVGDDLAGGAVRAGINVTECQLSGPQQDMPGHIPAVSLTLALGQLPGHLNEPTAIGALPTEPPGWGSIAAYPGERFSGSLKGTAVFTNVDLAPPAFVGRIETATVVWTGDAGHSFSCTITGGAFWGVPGGFQ